MPIILDDRPARRAAAGLGLEVTGTGGVLVLAKRRGPIPELRPLLLDLRAPGFHLGEDVVQAFLDLADER